MQKINAKVSLYKKKGVIKTVQISGGWEKDSMSTLTFWRKKNLRGGSMGLKGDKLKGGEKRFPEWENNKISSSWNAKLMSNLGLGPGDNC